MSSQQQCHSPQEGLRLFCFDYGLCYSGSHSVSQCLTESVTDNNVSQLYLAPTCRSCVENILKLGFCIKHWVVLSCIKLHDHVEQLSTISLSYIFQVSVAQYARACIQCSKSPKDLLERGKCFRQWHSGMVESGGYRACHFLTVNTSEVAFTDIEYVWSVIQWCLLNTLSVALTQQYAAQSKAGGSFLTNKVWEMCHARKVWCTMLVSGHFV